MAPVGLTRRKTEVLVEVVLIMVDREVVELREIPVVVLDMVMMVVMELRPPQMKVVQGAVVLLRLVRILLRQILVVMVALVGNLLILTHTAQTQVMIPAQRREVVQEKDTLAVVVLALQMLGRHRLQVVLVVVR
jgi:hypothetical protein